MAGSARGGDGRADDRAREPLPADGRGGADVLDLADPALERVYQPYDAWAAWARRQGPDDPPPGLEGSCGG